jgi:hypothetical protein
MSTSLAIFLFAPPILTILWLWGIWTWSFIMQGGRTSSKTNTWLRKGGWVVFALAYLALGAGWLMHKL